LPASDGIKISKEADKMPGVKRLHQDSDNSGKAAYIYGHHHPVIGILVLTK
jgi:metallophosphoesterase superfamily enzyme